ncbi:MAG: hypothetical protein R2697_09660 [Ilumatobacteraceae bacterium]
MGALLRAIVVVGGLILTVVGIPWAIRQLVRYQFVPQAVVSEHRDARSALDRSSDLVRGRWWWTAGVVLGVEAVVASLGFEQQWRCCCSRCVSSRCGASTW